MAKGSQLSQLKSALSQAGLAKQPQNGKKRKRTPLDEKEKERKAAKLREIQQKMNPFDTKVTKLKHDVGGRKIAGVVGRPAQSKQAGIEQRKKTLLKEFEERDRTGGIVDRRFGENDPSMSLEERMLERFTRERQRSSKGAAFNLDDEDELTHYGQSLSKLDDFDNVGLGLDDEEEEGGAGQIDSRTVQRSHFGGFEEDEEEDEEGEPERKRSKAEVMAEVMAKSKEHKYARQAQQEEDEHLRHELDQELDSLRSLLYAPDPSAAPQVGENGGEAEKRVPAPLAAVPTQDKEQDQEYDQFVRELAFDKRAKPKDRTKTEEELALEEKEALEKAERQRLRRMRGDEESDSEAEDGRKGKKRQTGGDDLDDDFMDEDEGWGLGTGLGAGAGENDGSIEDEGEEEEEDGDEEVSESEEDEDASDEQDEGMISESEAEDAGEEGEEEALVSIAKKAKKKSSATKKKELPYTFPCPTTHDEFLDIIEDVDDSDLPTVVKRIRAVHHPSLAEDNKFKLQNLTGVLLEHILYVTSPPSPRFTILSPLIPHLYALTKQYPIQAANHFVSKLNLMQKNLKRGLSHGVTEYDSKTWPGLSELSFLRVVGLIWPTSDLNHHVASPARLLMGSYLGLCRVRSLQDITSGLFLCTLFLQYEQLSKRLVPEAINFLINSLLHLAPNRFEDEASLPGSFPAPDFKSVRCIGLVLGKKSKKCELQKPDLPKLLGDDMAEDQAKVDLLGLAVDLLGQYADLYKSLEAFVELYEPVSTLLNGIKRDALPATLSTKFGNLEETIERLLKFSRQSRRPLALQAHKPIPIPTYVPRFEHTTSNYLRNRDPDHERNETSKLKAQYKQERKGAIRELRKDARFLAAEQQKKEKEKDRAYNMRMKRVLGSLEGERAEEKAMEKEKLRDKKRAGRK